MNFFLSRQICVDQRNWYKKIHTYDKPANMLKTPSKFTRQLK